MILEYVEYGSHASDMVNSSDITCDYHVLTYGNNVLDNDKDEGEVVFN